MFEPCIRCEACDITLPFDTGVDTVVRIDAPITFGAAALIPASPFISAALFIPAKHLHLRTYVK